MPSSASADPTRSSVITSYTRPRALVSWVLDVASRRNDILLVTYPGGQEADMFEIARRDHVRDRVLDLGASDPRVVAGAVVGSQAHDEGDRWSDLDLMFAVANDVPVSEVLETWTETVIREFGAVHRFDLPSGQIIYRVFLLPEGLELDLSFTSASQFGPSGPKVRLAFGEVVPQPDEPPAPAEELFGYAVHHTRHARVAIERGRPWLAEYWISALRDKALHLACRRRGLDGWYGRDFDRLPAEILDQFEDALVRSLGPGELRRAFNAPSKRFFANRLRRGRWSPRSRDNCGNWPRYLVSRRDGSNMQTNFLESQLERRGGFDLAPHVSSRVSPPRR